MGVEMRGLQTLRYWFGESNWDWGIAWKKLNYF